jgi:hypothetical protein
MLELTQLIGFGAGGSGGIQFVGGATAAKAGAASGNSTIALNSGLTGGIAAAVSNGDFVLAVYLQSASPGDLDLSNRITDGTTNYTLVGSELFEDDTNDVNLRVGYKFVSGDTATTFGPSGDTGQSVVNAVYVFRNVNPSTPIDVTVTTATGIDSAYPNPPSISPTTPGAFIVVIGGAAHRLGTTNYNTPIDLIDFRTASLDATGSECTLGIGHKDDWVSGSFDPGSWTLASDSANSSWAAMSIALRPA